MSDAERDAAHVTRIEEEVHTKVTCESCSFVFVARVLFAEAKPEMFASANRCPVGDLVLAPQVLLRARCLCGWRSHHITERRELAEGHAQWHRNIVRFYPGGDSDR